MTIAIADGQVHMDTPAAPRRPSRRRRLVKRIFLVVGAGLFAVMTILATLVGVSLWRIDHNVHHVGVPAALLAKGKNDLLAIVRGPDHSEEAYVFHQTDSTTKVLTIPSALAVPLAVGRTVPLKTLDIHTPSVIIAGLDKLGIPVSHYVGVDLHAVSPDSNLGQLASGKLSITSMISNPTGTTSLHGSGGLAHLPWARYPGIRRPVPHERPDGTPGRSPDVSGFLRQRGPGVGLHRGPARLPVTKGGDAATAAEPEDQPG